MIKELYISNNIVLIDEADYELVSQYTWHLSDMGYAVWRGVKDGRKQTIRMHRLITDCPAGKIIDHLNHDTLDNRRSNLRICTQSDNMRNKTNQGKGYWYHSQNHNWVVDINCKHRGSFATEQEAIDFAALVRSGQADKKPKEERLFCKYGHNLKEVGMFNGNICKTCHCIRTRAYFARTYVPKPRVIVTICSRGHDKSLYRTGKNDCSMCVKIRDKMRRIKV